MIDQQIQRMRALVADMNIALGVADKSRVERDITAKMAEQHTQKKAERDERADKTAAMYTSFSQENHTHAFSKDHPSHDSRCRADYCVEFDAGHAVTMGLGYSREYLRGIRNPDARDTIPVEAAEQVDMSDPRLIQSSLKPDHIIEPQTPTDDLIRRLREAVFSVEHSDLTVKFGASEPFQRLRTRVLLALAHYEADCEDY